MPDQKQEEAALDENSCVITYDANGGGSVPESQVKERGAELITIHPDASWELKQIPLTSITG